MEMIKNMAIALHNDEDGATATEYIVLLVLVACFVIGIIALFGESIENMFNDANTEVNNMSPTGGYSGTSGMRN